jgi:hypothetical protein
MVELLPRPEPCVLCTAEARPLIENYFVCPVCDVRFLDPKMRLTRAEEEKRYRTHNNDIADSGYRAFLTPIAEAVHARVSPAARGLDYGCGPGPLLARILTELGHTMQTYDPIFQPQPPTPPFDFITATEVIEHMFTPREDFARLHSWLKPGGWLALMTAFVEPSTDFAGWYYRRDPSHVTFYSRPTMHWLANKLSFAPPVWVGERIVLLHKA